MEGAAAGTKKRPASLCAMSSSSSGTSPSSARPGRLWAIADLHLSYKINREELDLLQAHPDDGLILCGDVGESEEQLRAGFERAVACFAQVWWVPGNHELYTLPQRDKGEAKRRGEAKYLQCVEIAQSMGVLTPEDDFVVWRGAGGPCVIAPIFTLYDYSFRPEHVAQEDAVGWAAEQNIVATDEHLLHNDPYASRIEWCHHLVARFEAKLAAAVMDNLGTQLVIVNHWPLREDLVTIPLVPRFAPWCGTKLTDDWHQRFNAKVVVSGHLHVRRTDWRDDTRFEEVSLGYPKQWRECRDRGMGINDLLREILPGPALPPEDKRQTLWRRLGFGTTATPAMLNRPRYT